MNLPLIHPQFLCPPQSYGYVMGYDSIHQFYDERIKNDNSNVDTSVNYVVANMSMTVGLNSYVIMKRTS